MTGRLRTLAGLLTVALLGTVGGVLWSDGRTLVGAVLVGAAGYRAWVLVRGLR
jgi:hypothetical protein